MRHQFFCAEVSAAVFENESLSSNFPVCLLFFFFLFLSPLFQLGGAFPPEPGAAPKERLFPGTGAEERPPRSTAVRRLRAPPPPLPPPSAPGGRAGQGLAFLLLLRRGGEVSGTFWRCRRKRPGGRRLRGPGAAPWPSGARGTRGGSWRNARTPPT